MRRTLLVGLFLGFVLVFSSLCTSLALAQRPRRSSSRCPSRRRRRSCPVEEPAVRIPVQEGDKVEEVREGGRVVMVKVTPPHGKPYYLVDTTGNGNWMRRDSLDDGVRVPMWPIHTWD